MKAGGVQVRRHARRGRRARRGRSSSWRSTATCRAACWSTPRPTIKQEYYAGVVWDGIRKQPVMLFSDMGGIDIEEVAEQHPDHVGRGHFSTILPLSATTRPRRSIASVGVTGRQLNAAHADPRPPGAPVRRARHDAGGDQPARRARGRQLRGRSTPTWTWRTRAARARRRCSPTSASATRRPARRASPPQFELAGEEVDAAGPPRRGGNVTEFDGNLGLVIGAGGGSLTLFDAVRAHGGRPANYCEIGGNPSVAQGRGPGQARAAEAGRGQDRGDDVDRLQHPRRHRRARRHQGLPGARLRPGREDRDLPHPGRLGGGGLQDPRASTASSTATAPCRCTRPPAARWRRSRGGGMSILVDESTTFIVQGITGREAVNLTRECLDYGKGAKIVGGVTPGRLGREVHGVPVFDTVEQAVEHHGGADRRLGRHGPAGVHQGRRDRGDRPRRQARRDRDRAHPARRRGPDGRVRRDCTAPASSAPTASGSSFPA